MRYAIGHRLRDRVRACRPRRRRDRRASSRPRSTRTPTASSTSACRRPTTTSCSSRTGRSRTRTTTSRRSGRPSRGCWPTTGVDPADVVGLGHRLHRLHDAADDRRRHAAVPARRSSAASRTPGSSSGSTTPPSPRRTGSTRSRRARGEAWLPRYGGRISSEWFFAKSLQILDEAPRRLPRRRPAHRGRRLGRLAADRRRDAQRLHRRLQGASGRRRDGFPDADFFAASTRAFATIVDDKMSRDVRSIGERAGGLSARGGRAGPGCAPGTPVAVANVDAHVSVPAVGVTAPGTMVAVMGTSTCHLVLGVAARARRGHVRRRRGRHHARAVRLRGRPVGGRRHLRLVHRAGRPAGGPRAGAARRARRPRRPRARGRAHCGRARSACSRSTGGTAIARSSSTSSSAGCSSARRSRRGPADIYRALLEATAFGTRVIIESLEAAGVAVDRVVACGGLPERNELLMQLTADITGPRVRRRGVEPGAGASARRCTARSRRARRGGGYDSIEDAAAAMARPHARTYRPDRGDGARVRRALRRVRRRSTTTSGAAGTTS